LAVQENDLTHEINVSAALLPGELHQKRSRRI